MLLKDITLRPCENGNKNEIRPKIARYKHTKWQAADRTRPYLAG